MPIDNPFADLLDTTPEPVEPDSDNPFADLVASTVPMREQERQRRTGSIEMPERGIHKAARIAEGYLQTPLAAGLAIPPSLIHGAVGLGAMAGVVPEETRELENQYYQGSMEDSREMVRGAPGAETAVGLVAGLAPFLTPGGFVTGPASMAGAGYSDARSAGATRGEATTSGAIMGATGAILPGVGRIVAPAAKYVGGAVGGMTGRAITGGLEGAAGGEVLQGGSVAAQSTYDPEGAYEQISNPESAATLAALGALGGAARGRGAVAPQAKTPFSDLIDPAAETQAMEPVREDQITPPTWQPHGPINTEPIKGPGSAINRVPTTEDVSAEAAILDAAIGRRKDVARIANEGRPVVGPDETQFMPRLQDDVATVPGESAVSMPTVSPQDLIRTQAMNPQVFPKTDIPVPEYATLDTGMADPVEVQRGHLKEKNRLADEKALEGAIISEQARAEADKILAAEQARIDEANQRQAVGKAAIDAKVQARDQRRDQAEGIVPEPSIEERLAATERERVDAEGHMRAAQLTASARERGLKGSFRFDSKSGLHDYQPGEAGPVEHIKPEHIASLSKSIEDLRAQLAPKPAEAPANVSEASPIAEPAKAIEPTESAPRPIASGDLAMVAIKGRPFEARVEEVLPDGRLKMTSADGRSFPAVDPSKVTKLDRSHETAPQKPPAATQGSAPIPAPRLLPKPAASVPAQRPTVSAPSEAQAPRLTAQTLRDQLGALPISRRSPGLVDANMAILEARAKSAGLSADDYIGRRFASVRESSTSPSLNQKGFLHEKSLDGPDQVRRGAVQFLNDGRAIVHAFEHANESTFLHESAHVFRRDLMGEELATVESWAKVRDGKWTPRAEEMFARGFERYVREGVAPTPELRPAFQRFYDWLKNIYQTIKGGPVDVKISPAVKRVMDRMLTKDAMKGLPEAPVIKAEAPSADIKAALSKPAEPKTLGEALNPKPEAKEPAKLANYGTTEPVREQVRKLDETRPTPEVEKRDDVRAQADANLAKDYEGEKKRIFDKAEAGEVLDSLEVATAMKIADRELEKANGNPEEMVKAQRIHMLYRDTGSQMARAFGMRHDPTATKREQIRRSLNDAIMSPNSRVLRKIDAAREAMETAKKAEDKKGFAVAKRQLNELKAQAASDLRSLLAKLKKEGADILFQKDADKVDPLAAIALTDRIMAHKDGTWPGVFREVFINNILSGIRTFTTNVSGSPLNAARIQLVNRSAEAFMNLFSKNDKAASFAEMKHMYTGVREAVNQAWADSLATFKTERSIFRGELGDMTEMDAYQHHISGRKGRVVRVVSRVSKAADQFWKTWIAYTEVGAQAHRIAKAAGYEGDAMAAHIKKLVDDRESIAWERAQEVANKATFNEKPGKLVDAAMKIRDWEAGEGTDFRPMFFLAPFIRTPASFFKQGIKMTPMGTGVALARVLRSAAGGKEYPREQMLKDAAEQMVAYAVTGVLAHYATATDEDGRPAITGSLESLPKGSRDALADMGVEPFSVRLFGSRWSYRNVEPFATGVGLTVDLLQSINKGGNIVGDAFNSVLGQVKSKTFLKSIGDVVNAIETSKREKTVGSGLVKMGMNFANSWVPNIIEATQRDFDPFIRDNRVAGTGADYWKEMGYTLAAQAFAPWAQAKSINVWGKPMVKNESGPTSSMVANLVRPVSPVGVRAVQDANDLDELILKWNEANPDATYNPSAPKRQRKKDGVTTIMGKADFEAYQIKAGELAVKRLKAAKLNPDAPKKWQIDRIKRELAAARKQTYNTMFPGETSADDD